MSWQAEVELMAEEFRQLAGRLHVADARVRQFAKCRQALTRWFLDVRWLLRNEQAKTENDVLADSIRNLEICAGRSHRELGVFSQGAQSLESRVLAGETYAYSGIVQPSETLDIISELHQLMKGLMQIAGGECMGFLTASTTSSGLSVWYIQWFCSRVWALLTKWYAVWNMDFRLSQLYMRWYHMRRVHPVRLRM